MREPFRDRSRCFCLLALGRSEHCYDLLKWFLKRLKVLKLSEFLKLDATKGFEELFHTLQDVCLFVCFTTHLCGFI